MTEGKTNQHPGPCHRCRRQVPAGEGALERVRADDGWGWVVTHRECPDEGAGPDVALWAVEAEGRTPMGHRASGHALVEGERPGGRCYPVSDVARRIVESEGQPHDDEDEARRMADGDAWLALWEVDRLVAQERSVAELDAALGERDVGAMRALVSRERTATLERFGLSGPADREPGGGG